MSRNNLRSSWKVVQPGWWRVVDIVRHILVFFAVEPLAVPAILSSRVYPSKSCSDMSILFFT